MKKIVTCIAFIAALLLDADALYAGPIGVPLTIVSNSNSVTYGTPFVPTASTAGSGCGACITKSVNVGSLNIIGSGSIQIPVAVVKSATGTIPNNSVVDTQTVSRVAHQVTHISQGDHVANIAAPVAKIVNSEALAKLSPSSGEDRRKIAYNQILENANHVLNDRGLGGY